MTTITLTDILKENPHIKEAEVLSMNGRVCVMNHFGPERELFSDIWDMMGQSQGLYGHFVTDSETAAYELKTEQKPAGNSDTPTYIWERYLIPAITKFKLDEEDAQNSYEGLRELYLNAAFYGSKVPRAKGNDLAVPNPAATARPITSDYLITRKFLLARITDVGEGFDLDSSTQLGEGGDMMTSTGRGLFLLKNLYGFDLKHYKSEDGSVVSALKKFTSS